MAAGTDSSRDRSPVAASARATSGAAARAQSFDHYVERLALRLALPAAAVAMLAVIVLNWNRNPVPLQADRTSFGSLAFYLTPLAVAIAGTVAYILGLREFNRRVDPALARRWEWGGLAVGLGMALVAAFLVAMGLELTERAFQGLEMAMAQGAFIAAAIVGMLTHLFARQAMKMDTGKALQLTLMALALGVYITATRIENTEWWRIAFSHLGSMASSVWYLFTIALVLSASIMLVWLSFVMRDVEVLIAHQRATPFARRFFVGGILWLAVALALVGLFPTQLGAISHWVHNIAAYSLALLFAIWFITLKRAIPETPPEMATLSVTAVVVMALTLFFAAIGYFNTVGLQVVLFVTGLTWLQEVVRFVSVEAKWLEPGLYPE
jgi:hypothetical protein